MSELLKVERHNIKLGDLVYELPLINLNILIAIEDEFGCGIGNLQEQFNKKQATTLRALAWAMLKDKYPELTKEEIGNNINLQNFQEITEQLLDVIKISLGE
jgi:hypothetical protein